MKIESLLHAPENLSDRMEFVKEKCLHEKSYVTHYIHIMWKMRTSIYT